MRVLLLASAGIDELENPYTLSPLSSLNSTSPVPSRPVPTPESRRTRLSGCAGAAHGRAVRARAVATGAQPVLPRLPDRPAQLPPAVVVRRRRRRRRGRARAPHMQELQEAVRPGDE